MREIDGFGLRRIDEEPYRSELLWQGDPIGLQVDGIVLEKQYCFERGYLLFLTDDCPYEEGLHVYLLSSERTMLDGLELGASYTPAILDRVSPETETMLTFCFFGGDLWRLEVRRFPRLVLALTLYSPLKFKGKLLAKRWLVLHRLR